MRRFCQGPKGPLKKELAAKMRRLSHGAVARIFSKSTNEEATLQVMLRFGILCAFCLSGSESPTLGGNPLRPHLHWQTMAEPHCPQLADPISGGLVYCDWAPFEANFEQT